MNLKNKKLMASKILKVGLTRVWFDPNKMNEIKESITIDEYRKLIRTGVILVKQKKGVSRGRVRKLLIQKRKGRRQGEGSNKGKHTARAGKKTLWVQRIRLYRTLLSDLLQKGLIDNKIYRDLRQKAKGGYFRSRRHILLYLTENSLWVKK